MGFSICVCVCTWCTDRGGSADGMFIWSVHIGYIRGGFKSKRPIVTIIESVWGLFGVIQVHYGDFFESVYGLREESE